MNVPNVRGTYPYCRVYSVDGVNENFESILICCDEGRIFEVNCDSVAPLSIDAIWKVFLLVLSVYYCFNIRYPAFYGLLEFLDRGCVDSDSGRDEPQAVCFNNFFKSFTSFVNRSNAS